MNHFKVLYNLFVEKFRATIRTKEKLYAEIRRMPEKLSYEVMVKDGGVYYRIVVPMEGTWGDGSIKNLTIEKYGI